MVCNDNKCYQCRDNPAYVPYKMSPEDDKDLQERTNFRKNREAMALLPPSEINPATGLPVEFSQYSDSKYAEELMTECMGQ